MNWNWSTKTRLLNDEAGVAADSRLKDIKKAAKAVKKIIEDSLKTVNTNKLDEGPDVGQKKTPEYASFLQVDKAAKELDPSCLHEEGNAVISPLKQVMERYAQLERNMALIRAEKEIEMAKFLASDTPLNKLLKTDVPGVNEAKKDLDSIIKQHGQKQNACDKEIKKLEKMSTEMDPDLSSQETMTKLMKHEVESLAKEVSMEQDKLTAQLLVLVSKEYHYASSIVELIKIKRDLYKTALKFIEVELPTIEDIIRDTQERPIFGEDISDHLRVDNRIIAYPIALAVTFMRKSGLHDEGIFRIPTQQIKLDKLKAHLDARLKFAHLLTDCDVHFFAALFKVYLRELPLPLFVSTEKKANSGEIYKQWMRIIRSDIMSLDEKIKEIRQVIQVNFAPNVQRNIQYIVKFLAELTKKSGQNKMTSHNLGIVIGPAVLWNPELRTCDPAQIETEIKVVSMMIDNYNQIWRVDLNWKDYDQDIVEVLDEVDRQQNSPSESRKPPKKSPITRVKKISRYFNKKVNDSDATTNEDIDE